MTKLMASVASREEAEIALGAGTDLVDFMAPARCAWSALEPEAVAGIVAALPRGAQTSAVTGDLPMEPDRVVAAAAAMAAAGADYVKVGLFAAPGRQDCIRALEALASKSRLIGVLFADQAPDFALVDLLAACDFAGAMLDTASKDGRRLLDHLAVPELAHFVDRCRAHPLVSGLAGSLEAPDIPRLLPLEPDYLGFRGALCDRGRMGALELKRVAMIRALIPRPGAARAVESVQPLDKLLVHDLVLPMRVGAYGHERGREQRVRFAVTAQVRRRTGRPKDMRDVFSYDVIVDTIRAIASEGHVDLLETVGERIAERLLRHPDLARVTLKIEKLDVAPAVVGIEMTRMAPPA